MGYLYSQCLRRTALYVNIRQTCSDKKHEETDSYTKKQCLLITSTIYV